MKRPELSTLVVTPAGSATRVVQLSSRELEVLRLLASGMVNKEVAERMSLRKQTIDTHRRNMLAKTGCRTTLQLMHLATKAGWLS